MFTELKIQELKDYMNNLKKNNKSEWYNLQLKGLFIILSDGTQLNVFDDKDCRNEEGIVHKSYLFEKMKLITDEIGVNFHPEILRCIVEKHIRENEK